METLTFLLAVAGYAGLTTAAVLAARGRLPRALSLVVALVVATHVVLVWAVRYDWSFSQATRNGYTGFVIFHVALALIVASVFVPARVARALVLTAFPIVSVGALGAVFRYDVVAVYRAPVVLLAVTGFAGLLMAWWFRRS
jgi:hypothetical protein